MNKIHGSAVHFRFTMEAAGDLTEVGGYLIVKKAV